MNLPSQISVKQKALLVCQKGQIAIFVALIFQVLFIFFAMVINVGLLIHDKINLQNSVDLAAYYAAQRQAEVLNAIGHTNYQIRQAWKLLAWRVRYLGDMGRTLHPALSFNVAASESPLYAFGSRSYPSVCIRYSLWRESQSDGQNLCQRQSYSIPAIPKVDLKAPFIGFNKTIENFVLQMRDISVRECQNIGPANWRLAVRWLATFRSDVASRKKLLYQLAWTLSENTDYFKELSGDDVREGTFATLQRNLTRANAAGFSKSNMKVFNSLGKFQVQKTDGPPPWLHAIPVTPLVYFTDAVGSTIADCTLSPVEAINNNMPWALRTDPARAQAFGADKILALQNEPTDINSPDHSILGVEKNPWYVAYVAVSAQTRTRKPFAPLGQPVTLTARAYAKPFGSSIGPWYRTAWSNGSAQSDGMNKTDPLLPEETSASNPTLTDLNIPNYSRFPGDTLGLRSKLALAGFRNTMIPFIQRTRSGLAEAYWGYLPGSFDGGSLDPLAWEKPSDPRLPPPNSPPWIRAYEIAAVAPDIFDATYYPVDVNFEKTYRTKILRQFGNDPSIRSDLGYHLPNLGAFTVNEQLVINKNSFAADVGYRPYVIQDWQKLLTSWVPRGDRNTRVFPDDKFMKCTSESTTPLLAMTDDAPPPVPGGCRAGGRAGYSIKIVSKKWLERGDLALGGANTSGPILNPPPQFGNDF